MEKTAAVYYKSEGYDTSGRRLMGRHSAGEGFLKGLASSSGARKLFCYALRPEDYRDFRKRIREWSGRLRETEFIPFREPQNLAEPGALHLPTPGLAEQAWVRRFHGQRSWSITGVVHTMCSQSVLGSIGEMLTAPLQPWDALVCPSQSVLTAVNGIISDYADYLEQRIGARPEMPVKLPVIPLGADVELFSARGRDREARSRLRGDLGFAEDDVVVLFLGRLIFYAKAHPAPMLAALERAAKKTGRTVRMIFAGWFEDEREKKSFMEAPAHFCPGVKTVFLDGRSEYVRQNVWAAADIFCSLADNVQETFGLTPIEAMAAGLPVVASDWNGYRETVVHGETGFLAPTAAPDPGPCLELGRDYLSGACNYSTYIAQASFAAAVDAQAAADALAALIADPELRLKMGDAGRKRAMEIYDWKVIIRQHEELWAELSDIRAGADEIAPPAPGAPPFPLGGDPFRLFGHYPAFKLSRGTTLSRGREDVRRLSGIWMTAYGDARRAPLAGLERAAELAAELGPVTAGELTDRLAEESDVSQQTWETSLLYLIKFDVLRIVNEDA